MTFLFGSSDTGCISDVPGSNCFRQHQYEVDANGNLVFPGTNGPIVWPDPPAGTVGFYTWYPNPVQLLAGELDATITPLLQAAAPGSLLTTYAEADAYPNEGGQFNTCSPPLSQAECKKVHTYMQKLCTGTNVRYGACVRDLAWAVPGLDFYSTDIYDSGTDGTDVIGHLNSFQSDVYALQPHGRIAISECNSPVESQRPGYFSDIFTWLLNIESSGSPGGIVAFMTYWNPTGTLSGPWDPTDTATVSALTSFAALAAEPAPSSAIAVNPVPNLVVTGHGTGSVSIQWDAVSGADTYGVDVYQYNETHVYGSQWSGTSGTISGLHSGWQYHITVQARPASSGAVSAGVPSGVIP